MTDAQRPSGSDVRTPVGADLPVKHVIEESRHRLRTVTCACGWHGSSASVNGQPSEWSRHVAAHRPPRP